MNSENFDYKQIKDVLWLALFFFIFRGWVRKEKLDSSEEFTRRENKDNYFNIGEWG